MHRLIPARLLRTQYRPRASRHRRNGGLRAFQPLHPEVGLLPAGPLCENPDEALDGVLVGKRRMAGPGMSRVGRWPMC